ncbi:MAG: YggS family pyridoxal phosphate-dependent enzyme [Gemmatimonadales bacterium]|nr:MAG: YggS family pyridoxal phosphate-dependent enzyme [Gemmatimonadales bacterium]
MDIAANLSCIHADIAAACARSDRDPATVRLVAVSKTHPAAAIQAAQAAGQTLFGENYVQEFLLKAESVDPPVTWHFLGHLQSNKVKYLAGKVVLIHSLDRFSLAEEIDRQWGKLGATAEVLIEVNLGGEMSKAGTAEAGLKPLLRRLAELPHLAVRGLMLLPPYCTDPEEVRPYFRRLRELAGEVAALNLPGITMAELSMGMSHDFSVSIEEGATLIRVGTAIFGERLGR